MSVAKNIVAQFSERTEPKTRCVGTAFIMPPGVNVRILLFAVHGLLGASFRFVKDMAEKLHTPSVVVNIGD